MIYELTYGGYRLGTFPTEAEAVRRAGVRTKTESAHFIEKKVIL